MNTISAYVTYLTSRFDSEDEGASMVEYGLLVALIALAAVVALGLVGDELGTFFTEIKDRLVGARGGTV